VDEEKRFLLKFETRGLIPLCVDSSFFVEKLFTFAVKETDLEAVTMSDVQKKSLNIINQVPTPCGGYTVQYYTDKL
jgi:hypothetical protein